MTWIRTYKQKILTFKISVDLNFTFTSYAWVHCHCSIDYCVNLTQPKGPLFCHKMGQNVCFLYFFFISILWKGVEVGPKVHFYLQKGHILDVWVCTRLKKFCLRVWIRPRLETFWKFSNVKKWLPSNLLAWSCYYLDVCHNPESMIFILTKTIMHDWHFNWVQY